MKTSIFLITILALLSNVAPAAELTMTHKIIVPQEYTNGRSQEAFEGTSDIERYVNAFERTWWAVMNKFSHNIKWKPRHDEFICSGTPAAAQGCLDGYNAAVKKVEDFLKKNKADEVQKFIKNNIGK